MTMRSGSKELRCIETYRDTICEQVGAQLAKLDERIKSMLFPEIDVK